jgi:hypothetical protein
MSHPQSASIIEGDETRNNDIKNTDEEDPEHFLTNSDKSDEYVN